MRESGIDTREQARARRLAAHRSRHFHEPGPPAEMELRELPHGVGADRYRRLQHDAAVDAGSVKPMFELKTLGLFVVTAIAEIVGCYLPYLWFAKGAPIWVLIPAAGSLAMFVWLLTLHPAAAGRVYAAYGGVYVATAIVWLWAVDGLRPTVWDVTGALVAIIGMAIIMLAPRHV